MQELIPITTDERGIQAVMGRDLHVFLEVGTEYRHWFPRMLAYGFEEGKDYTVKNDHTASPAGIKERLNHVVSLDMAKEISMIQRTEKGKQVRQYFIEVEKRYRASTSQLSRMELIQLAMQAEQERLALKEKTDRQAKELEVARPKALFADSVAASQSTILIGDLAKILKGNGINIGANRMFSWLREHGYLISRKGQDWNSPTQKAMELGLFKIKETAVTHSDGHVTINKTTKVTGKGQLYFIQGFKEGRFTIN